MRLVGKKRRTVCHVASSLFFKEAKVQVKRRIECE